MTVEEIEKEYKEWCVNLIKVRFDLKPEYYDEHHHNNYTYENCADCLWNRIKGTIEELLWLKEDYYKLHEQLILWKDKVKQVSKETAEKDFNAIIQALEERKDRVKAIYGVYESVGVDIAIRTVKGLAKQYRVEEETPPEETECPYYKEI